jgi:anti-sigma regulatory factor (Ser/Thr protein kinase)
LQLTIASRLDELSRAHGAVTEYLEQEGVPAAAAYAVDLVLEEIVTNIVKYAFPGGDRGRIEVRIETSETQVVATFEDGGIPFDPTSHRQRPPGGGLADRPVGGVGLTLVHEMVDELAYERDGQKNRLVVRVARR